MADFQRIAAGPADPASPPGDGSCVGWLMAAVRRICSGTVEVGDRSVVVGRLLGEGGYAYVHSATDAATGEVMALKRILCQTEEQLEAARREVRVHERVGSHTSLMPLLASAVAPSRVGGGAQDVLLLMPMASQGTLSAMIRSHVDAGTHLSEQAVLSVLADVARGLAHMHGAGGVAHRDVKPANVLLGVGPPSTGLTAAPAATLIDYGSAAPVVVALPDRPAALRLQDEASRHSSMAYRAPELWEPSAPGEVTGASDVWSLGCLGYACMYGLSPFESRMPGGALPDRAGGAAEPLSRSAGVGGRAAEGFAEAQPCTLSRVLGGARFPSEERDPFTSALRRLVTDCLARDPADRPRASDVADRAASLLLPGAGDAPAPKRGAGPVPTSSGARSVMASGAGRASADEDDFNPFA